MKILEVISKHVKDTFRAERVDFVRLYVKGICDDGFSINRFINCAQTVCRRSFY